MTQGERLWRTYLLIPPYLYTSHFFDSTQLTSSTSSMHGFLSFTILSWIFISHVKSVSMNLCVLCRLHQSSPYLKCSFSIRVLSIPVWSTPLICHASEGRVFRYQGTSKQGGVKCSSHQLSSFKWQSSVCHSIVILHLCCVPSWPSFLWSSLARGERSRLLYIILYTTVLMYIQAIFLK